MGALILWWVLAAPDCPALQARADGLRQQVNQAFQVEKDYRRALELLDQMFELTRSGCTLAQATPAQVTWNRARCFEELRQPAEVLRAVQLYRTLTAEPADLAKARELLARHTGGVELRCNASGDVQLLELGTKSLCPGQVAELLPGAYRVRASSLDGIPWEGSVTVVAGRQQPLVIDFLGEVELRGLPANARMMVDGVPELEASFRVIPGSHFLQVDSPGHQRWERPVMVDPGRKMWVEYEGLPHTQRRTGVSPWITLGSATVLAVSAGVSYGLASERYSDAEALDPLVEAEARNDLIDQGDNLQVVAVGSLVGLGVALGIAWWLWPEEEAPVQAGFVPGGVGFTW